MNTNRLSISIHILTLLAMSKKENIGFVSSEYVASSININPVIVRKEIANLKRHGLVASKEGKFGGSALAKDASSITMAEIYEIVINHDVLGKNISNPNPDCPVGRQINSHLGRLFDETERFLLASLSATTLEEFCSRFENS